VFADGDLVAGKFRIDHVIGRGGMGLVVAATHVHLGQRVALKFLLPKVLGNPEAVTRFLREARAAVRLSSEHVTRLLDVGELEDGTPFLVMDRLHGSTLDAALAKRGALPDSLALALTAQVLAGLSAAHSLGIMHRDIKPANVFLVKPSGSANDTLPVAKLLDFGLAKAPFERSLVSTRPGHTVGTPSYMAPEVISGARSDQRSDLWAVSVMLFEMLTGSHPFPENGKSYSFPALRNPPARLTDFLPGVSTGIEQLLQVALEKDPNRRFQTAEDMRVAVLRVAGELGQPRFGEVATGSDDMIPVIEGSWSSSSATWDCRKEMREDFCSSGDSTERIVMGG